MAMVLQSVKFFQFVAAAKGHCSKKQNKNMARKKKEFPILEQIKITAVAAEGKALARVNDLVVFVPYVVPGDVVD